MSRYLRNIFRNLIGEAPIPSPAQIKAKQAADAASEAAEAAARLRPTRAVPGKRYKMGWAPGESNKGYGGGLDFEVNDTLHSGGSDKFMEARLASERNLDAQYDALKKYRKMAGRRKLEPLEIYHKEKHGDYLFEYGQGHDGRQGLQFVTYLPEGKEEANLLKNITSQTPDNSTPQTQKVTKPDWLP